MDRSESIIVVLLLRNLDAVVDDDMLSECCSCRVTGGKNSPKSRMRHAVVVAAGVNIAGVGGSAAGPAPFRVAVGTVTDVGVGASFLGML